MYLWFVCIMNIDDNKGLTENKCLDYTFLVPTPLLLTLHFSNSFKENETLRDCTSGLQLWHHTHTSINESNEVTFFSTLFCGVITPLVCIIVFLLQLVFQLLGIAFVFLYLYKPTTCLMWSTRTTVKTMYQDLLNEKSN